MNSRLHTPPDIVMMSSAKLLSHPMRRKESEACSHFNAWTVIEYNVMAPVGSLTFGDTYPVNYPNRNYQIVFRFRPNKLLGFNITLVRLFFPHHKNSFLTISNHYFRGEYSSFNLFLNEDCFEIIANINFIPFNPILDHIQHITLHHFDAIFVLMDRWIVDTKQTEGRIKQTSFQTKLFFIRNDICIQSLYLKAPKHKHLSVHTEVDSFSVVRLFDCPDTSCGSTIMQQEVQSCSTFQCAVEILLTADNILAINYSTNNVWTDKTYLLEQSHTKGKITLPFSSCGPLCTLLIQAISASQINVTIDEVSFAGATHHQCLFGGLFYFDIFQQQNKPNLQIIHQSDIICDNFSDSSSKRTILSSNGTLLISVFSYPPESLIKASLVVEQTNCKVIHLCSCVKKDVLCPDQPFENSVHIGGSIQPQVYFHIQPNKCLVLKKDKHFQHSITCVIRIDPMKGLYKTSNLVYLSQWSFGSLFSYVEKFSPRKCLKRQINTYCDNLVIQTALDDDLKCWKNITPSSFRTKCYKFQNCQNARKRNHFHENKTYFMASYTSGKTNAIAFQFIFLPFSSTWFDVIILHKIKQELSDDDSMFSMKNQFVFFLKKHLVRSFYELASMNKFLKCCFLAYLLDNTKVVC